MMKRKMTWTSLGLLVLNVAAGQTGDLRTDSALVREVFSEVLTHGEAHRKPARPLQRHWPSTKGSPSADRAIAWGQAMMEQYGADTSYIMPVTVPAWTRGDVAEASAKDADGRVMPLHVTALGGSVPTPKEGWIEGPLLVVRQLDALDTLDARGHIVLFNRPMDPLLINTGAAYGGHSTNVVVAPRPREGRGHWGARPLFDPCPRHPSAHGFATLPSGHSTHSSSRHLHRGRVRPVPSFKTATSP